MNDSEEFNAERESYAQEQSDDTLAAFNSAISQMPLPIITIMLQHERLVLLRLVVIKKLNQVYLLDLFKIGVTPNALENHELIFG